MAPLLSIGAGLLFLLRAPQLAKLRAAEVRRLWGRELPGEHLSVHLFRLVGAGFIVGSTVQL